MTTSPAATASAALAAARPPFAAKVATAAGTMSKPVTWCPALTRLAAIGAPILPSPIKPIAVIRPSPAHRGVAHVTIRGIRRHWKGAEPNPTPRFQHAPLTKGAASQDIRIIGTPLMELGFFDADF